MKLGTALLLAAFSLPVHGDEPPPGWHPGPLDQRAIERSLDSKTIPEDMDGDLAFGPIDGTDRWTIDYIKNLRGQAGKLKLTVKQLDELGRLSCEFRVKRVRLRAALAESRLRLHRSLTARPPDFVAAATAVEAEANILRELSSAAIETIRAAYETLTSDQRNHLDAGIAP